MGLPLAPSPPPAAEMEPHGLSASQIHTSTQNVTSKTEKLRGWLPTNPIELSIHNYTRTGDTKCSVVPSQ